MSSDLLIHLQDLAVLAASPLDILAAWHIEIYAISWTDVSGDERMSSSVMPYNDTLTCNLMITID